MNRTTPWPYPFWIAHRGAGKLAPENTLAAFRLGASLGYRMFECDAKLSQDGVAFLLHDDTLCRTTSAQGNAANWSWAHLAQLDAGAWHSVAFAGEPIPPLEAVLAWCEDQGALLNVEIKPCPGREAITGFKVAQQLSRHRLKSLPLITSFSAVALEGAMKAAPHLPRGLLCESWYAGWMQDAQRLQCNLLVAAHSIWSPQSYAQAQALGLKTWAYTVNDAQEAKRLASLGLDGLITDRLDSFSPNVWP